MLLRPLSQGALCPHAVCLISTIVLYLSKIPRYFVNSVLFELKITSSISSEKHLIQTAPLLPINTAFYTVMHFCVYCQGKLERLHGVLCVDPNTDGGSSIQG